MKREIGESRDEKLPTTLLSLVSAIRCWDMLGRDLGDRESHWEAGEQCGLKTKTAISRESSPCIMYQRAPLIRITSFFCLKEGQ